MDNRKIFMYIGFIFILSSCGKLNNPKERNILSFKSNIDSVFYKIKEMNSILKTTTKKYFIFGINKKNILFIEDSTHKIKDVGFIFDTLLYKSELLKFINSKKRSSFVKDVIFLNNNFLTQCNEKKGKYLYSYRANMYMADRQEDLQRYVVYAKDKSEIEFLLKDNFINAASGGKYNLAYKILDHKGNLYLLAHKDAEIWEN